MKLPPHAAALIVIAATVIFLMVAGFLLVDTLGANGWCPAAIGADKAVGQPSGADAVTACVGLLTLQVKALSLVAYIVFGAVALIALFLVVVVLASGQLRLKVNAQGADVDIGQVVVPGAGGDGGNA